MDGMRVYDRTELTALKPGGRRTLLKFAAPTMHFVVSTVSVPRFTSAGDFTEVGETLAFRCDADGEVTDWAEFAGTMYVSDHEGVIAQIVEMLGGKP